MTGTTHKKTKRQWRTAARTPLLLLPESNSNSSNQTRVVVVVARAQAGNHGAPIRLFLSLLVAVVLPVAFLTFFTHITSMTLLMPQDTILYMQHTKMRSITINNNMHIITAMVGMPFIGPCMIS